MSLTQKVYDGLKDKILRLEYDADELIIEKDVAAEFGVSKTPAREALAMLCQEGYVIRYPNHGYAIRELSQRDVADIFESRFIVESGAVRLIIRYADDDEIRELYDILEQPDDTYDKYHKVNAAFHGKLGELTKNEYLHETILRMANATARPSPYVKFKSRAGTPENYHRLITDALLNRDVEGAIYFLKKDILSKKSRQIY